MILNALFVALLLMQELVKGMIFNAVKCNKMLRWMRSTNSQKAGTRRSLSRSPACAETGGGGGGGGKPRTGTKLHEVHTCTTKTRKGTDRGGGKQEHASKLKQIKKQRRPRCWWPL